MSSLEESQIRKNIGWQLEEKNKLQVTFSKRHFGLFKKASEICTLCGVEAIILVFSPGNKAYSFGHPDVNTIVNRFLSLDSILPGPSNYVVNCYQMIQFKDECQRALELAHVESLVEDERRHRKELDQMVMACQCQHGIPASIDDLNFQQLNQLKWAILNFKSNLETYLQKIEDSMMSTCNIISGTAPEFFAGVFPNFAASTNGKGSISTTMAQYYIVKYNNGVPYGQGHPGYGPSFF